MTRLSQHAQLRAAQMGVDDTEVCGVVDDPEVTYPSPPGHGVGRHVAVGGRLAVGYGVDGTVITVLWRSRTGRDPSPLAA